MNRSDRLATLGAAALRGVTSVAIAGSAGLAAVAFAASPADAAPSWTTVAARMSTTSRLWLTVAKGESVRPAQQRVWLTCNPDGGSHPDPAAACAAISAAKGDLSALPPGDMFCTMQYDPVTVTADGWWKGRPVHYRHTFGNGCVLRNETGPVFAG